MEVFKKILTPGKPEDGEPGTPSTPTRKATCASQDAVAQKEMADLHEIKQDSERHPNPNPNPNPNQAASEQARHWLHGFREVAPGSGAECQLCVVGLLE